MYLNLIVHTHPRATYQIAANSITKETSSEGISSPSTNGKRPNKLSMVTTLIFVTATFLVITAPPDEGTSSAKKEALKPVVVITGQGRRKLIGIGRATNYYSL